MKRALLLVPLAILALFVAAALWRLSSPPDPTIRSRLAGQPLPAFSLPAAVPGRPALDSAAFADGQPRLLNLFASWCVPCIAEAPMLLELERRGVTIEAIAVRDRPEDVARFLQRHGDPFRRIGLDTASKVQLSLGSAGVPESFVIDGRGIIRYQHVGVITAKDLPVLMAELEKAR
ncbi:DsbE family thiol:disulfide interchange protein [Sphingomonas mesophila]|uniref:DsbE family thiol:disulfide interchange protein n=1 Tax=Sphingomonas mesophila TaxID=2303576 RepID=UPI000E577FFE|nr:DsbE family thiol:disulfide interchange protein [Sphingomonas mesophila]